MVEVAKVSLPFYFDKMMDSATKLVFNGLNVWVCKSGQNLSVFYDECAHMGSPLESNGKYLVCPQHGWTYDFSGRNIQTGGPNLRKAKVVSINSSTIEVLLPTNVLKLEKAKLTHPLQIDVHSHATLEIKYRGTNVIFDPWLEGPAYYGAWHLYPKPTVVAQDLNVEAIVITHPHPDHFHLPTLEKMNKKLPIFFPQFPSRLIEVGLKELGFTNPKPIFWGETFSIGNHFNARFLRPRSMWEDSATYVWVEDEGVVFNWLNLVDAGSVIDEFSIPDLDLLTSAFDQGASGYPITWTHLSEQRKRKMLEAQKRNTLNILPMRARKLNARYFLPFAGHWRLGLDIHRSYAELIPHTTFEEISETFAANAPRSKFLGLYPGQSFDFQSQQRDFRNTQKLINIKVDSGLNPSDVNFQETIDQGKIDSFRLQMFNLVQLAESFGSENVEFEVTNTENSYSDTFHFFSSHTRKEEKIKISVQIPGHILSLLSENKANWDHVAIGYWGIWSRNPDRYPANFMRLLQSGNSQLQIDQGLIHESGFEFILEKSVGDIIEKEGVIASKLLSRLGLPCISCIRSNSETLAQAMEIHNLDIDSSSWILRDLASRYPVNLLS
jgi:CMP-N-acetylneuraminate monooxygenase